MNIIKNINGTAFTLTLEGRLDTTTAPQLEAVVKNELTGVKELTFDMNKLEYISSAGLRVLLSAQKIMNKQGEMTVTGCSEEIMEIFEVTGFSDILNIQ
jgi:anti-sigma B factor antagonist